MRQLPAQVQSSKLSRWEQNIALTNELLGCMPGDARQQLQSLTAALKAALSPHSHSPSGQMVHLRLEGCTDTAALPLMKNDAVLTNWPEPGAHFQT
jgi:hypothetical protein